VVKGNRNQSRRVRWKTCFFDCLTAIGTYFVFTFFVLFFFFFFFFVLCFSSAFMLRFVTNSVSIDGWQLISIRKRHLTTQFFTNVYWLCLCEFLLRCLSNIFRARHIRVTRACVRCFCFVNYYRRQFHFDGP